MNDSMHLEMAEVTRLTRAGQLTEATALIQRTLRAGSRRQRHPTPVAAPPRKRLTSPAALWQRCHRLRRGRLRERLVPPVPLP